MIAQLFVGLLIAEMMPTWCPLIALLGFVIRVVFSLVRYIRNKRAK